MKGQNPAKFFEMFNNISKIVPWNAPVNESNFEKVILQQLLQVSWSSKAFSEEASIVKALMLQILYF